MDKQVLLPANTAKVTNATHTGDVTGDTTLTIAVDAVDIAMLSATGTAGSTTFLRGDNAWATAGSTSASDLTSGTLPDARFPSALPAISGANLTNNGALVKLTSGTISSSTTNVDINLSSYTSTYERFKIIVDNWTCDAGTMSINKLTASNTPLPGGWYGGYYRVGEGNTYGREGFSNLASFKLTEYKPTVFNKWAV